MPRPTAEIVCPPPSPAKLFALLQRARLDRDPVVYAVARHHLAALGIHVSFAPSAELVDLERLDGLIGRIADGVADRLRSPSAPPAAAG